jgi:hypothetical protein
MKILVIGGMHGNEPLGIEVIKFFNASPAQEVDTLLANKKAITKDCRFISNDLNRSFPGNLNSKDYETRRAAEILAITKKYDLVLDFHNTHCPDNDCGFVGESAQQKLFDVSAWLGINRVIVADYDCINKYALNCISIEISLASPEMKAKDWYDKIIKLSRLKVIPKTKVVQRYRFVYRMTLEDRDRLDLKNQGLAAFKQISPRLANNMNVSNPAYPIFIGDSYTPYNYGGLLRKA